MDTYKRSEWKSWTALSKEELEEPSEISCDTKYKIPPSYYCDINGKEWIVILKPDYPGSQYQSLKHPRCDSYLYDVKNVNLYHLFKIIKKIYVKNLTSNHKKQTMRYYPDTNPT